MTNSPAWSDALDTLEERLRRQDAVVRGEAPAVTPAGPLPVPDGPFPAELLPRALALLERCRNLEVEAETAMAMIERERAARPGEPAASAYPTATTTTVVRDL